MKTYYATIVAHHKDDHDILYVQTQADNLFIAHRLVQAYLKGRNVMGSWVPEISSIGERKTRSAAYIKL